MLTSVLPPSHQRSVYSFIQHLLITYHTAGSMLVAEKIEMNETPKGVLGEEAFGRPSP